MNYENAETRWGRCSWCGKFVRNMTSFCCAECSAELHNDKSPAVTRYKPRYIVIEDPLPYSEGGYVEGAGFSTNDHDYNLRFGGYTPGTILRDDFTGATLKIFDSEQKMKAIEIEKGVIAG